MLATLPALAQARIDTMLADVVDMGVLAGLGGFDGDALTNEMANMLPQPGSRAMLAFRLADGWERVMGFRRRDLDGIIMTPTGLGEVSVWVFKDPATAHLAFAGLPSRGFEPSPFPPDLPDALGNGPVGRLQLARRDATNFFKGPLGRPLVAAQRGKALIFSDFPTFMHGLSGWPIDPSWLRFPQGQRSVLRGYIISSLAQGALQALDRVLPADAVMPQARLSGTVVDHGDAPAASMRRLPAFEAVVVARVEGPGAWRGAALSIPYDGCDQARDAVAALDEQWAHSIASATTGIRTAQFEASVSEVEGNVCAAVGLVRLQESAASPLEANAAYSLLERAMELRSAGTLFPDDLVK